MLMLMFLVWHEAMMDVTVEGRVEVERCANIWLGLDCGLRLV